MNDLVIFPSKTTSEEALLTFDFTSVLPFGAALTEVVTVTCTVFSGTDENPSDVLNGSAIIVSGSNIYYVPTHNGISGVIYSIRVAANYDIPTLTTGIAVLTGKLAVMDTF